ncbi:hypothetical protein OUZ56_001143 [Daphnia magna]|uniref:Uncharacterized protein n=1 Tax=Daphnia magna TaxID=35525 RepID=A0ABR0A1R9_9CRUS|nr:hypothetical protein OUZ56_001143 [Daphnia magna]
MAKTIFSSPSQHNQLFVPAAKQKAAQIYPPIFAHYRNHKGISTGTTSKQQVQDIDGPDSTCISLAKMFACTSLVGPLLQREGGERLVHKLLMKFRSGLLHFVRPKKS